MIEADPIRPRNVDVELVEVANDLESLPGEFAALLDARGRQTDPDRHELLVECLEAAVDVLRLAHATGPTGLRAKARAALAEGVLDGSPASVEIARRLAEDVLRLVPDEASGDVSPA